MVTNRRRSASPHSQQVERNATFNVVYASFWVSGEWCEKWILNAISEAWNDNRIDWNYGEMVYDATQHRHCDYKNVKYAYHKWSLSLPTQPTSRDECNL
jgi:hypothetical protein